MWLWLSNVKRIRFGTIIAGVSNVIVVVIGGFLVLISYQSCDRYKIFPIVVVSTAAGLKFCTMIKAGMAQEATAKTVLDSAADAIIRHERRIRYNTWLWWTRLVIVISFFQFLGATYLMFNMAKYISDDTAQSSCILGVASNGNWWMKKLLVLFVIMVCFVALVQCFIGSDILRWRSFYATQDDVWKAHYHEVFDHSIREIMCCFGRVEYLTVSEEDEIYSVAKLLGDLVAYRASGTGHLELLAGENDYKYKSINNFFFSHLDSWMLNCSAFEFRPLDPRDEIYFTFMKNRKRERSKIVWRWYAQKIERHSHSSISYEGYVEAPGERLQEAATFHKFAEGAYTGPLLDVGRNPILFPCAWLYRQGMLNLWTRNRRPVLDGDNWWRGHAAAFLKHINLSQDVLRRGRVCKERCKATYFILVLHHLRSVVIAVRGTESPEDLITDSLGKECLLSSEDLDGLLNNSHIKFAVKQSVDSSFPHYGHWGIVEAARELYMQVEGNTRDDYSGSTGFLSSLLRAGCECDGYNVRIVGHSLGGSIGVLLGLRLYGRFPNLHVYAYGALPCVDSVIANACTEFVTSIVYDNEFSARLSVGSILRLRAAAIMALSQDRIADTTSIFRLARQFLHSSECEICKVDVNNPAEYHSDVCPVEDLNQHIYEGTKEMERDFSRLNKADSTIKVVPHNDEFINPFHDIAVGENQLGDPVSQFMETVPRSENVSAWNPIEMLLPGLVIHIVPQQKNLNIPLWKSWKTQKRVQIYTAFVANRENFTDIVVSASMFLDHLPWRCFHAMRKVLEAQKAQKPQDAVDRLQMV